MNYFTERHFELLERWQGRKYDNSDPKQRQAYEELQAAYAVTEDWAHQIKQKLFPSGIVRVIKRPTSQGNQFLGYNWARIYPDRNSPEYLAYTVGISASDGFQIKIDTVRLRENDPVRQAYETIRDNFDNSSPIVALLPRAEGLGKTFLELVQWTVEAIDGFRLKYDNVWAELEGNRILDDDELLRHFDSQQAFATFRAGWTLEYKALFCRLARAVHDAALDWWHISDGIQVRCGRKDAGAHKALGRLAIVDGQQRRTIRFKDLHPIGDILTPDRHDMTEKLVDQIEAGFAAGPNFPDDWQRDRPGLWPDQLQTEPAQPDDAAEDEQQEAAETGRLPLNTILYGPPGTGKTYSTIGRCVQICDGKTPEDAEERHARYGQLMDEGRIDFVTFHQSYGYEEFVEGIRPIPGADAGGGIQLRVESGILKRIAERARNVAGVGSRRIFKMSLADPRSWSRGPAGDPVFAECLESGFVLLEFGGDIDWSDARYDDWNAVWDRWREENNPDATAYDTDIQAIWRFRVKMRRGDIVVASDGYRRFRAVGEIMGDYEFQRREDGFHHRRAVKWHWHVRDREGEPGSVFIGGRFHWRPVNLLKPSNPAGLMRYLTGIDGLAGAQPHVLVIDEINRANISKVMGELITLLEEDKREGAENEVVVTLPYSGERFALPANLHILGTMNTADRSIAVLDTALRRRFRFEELSPKPELLDGARERTGVDLPNVLRVINQRLEYLVDRDHLIGHAWFMGTETRDDVDAIMRYKIIPLIAEYFYDDWSKVHAVLGGTDHFVERRRLSVPPGLENDTTEERNRWTVRERLGGDAYRYLVGADAPPEGGE